MKAFEYELRILKQTKKLENEQKIDQFRRQLQEQMKQKMKAIEKEYDTLYEKYYNSRKQQNENKIW